MKKNKSKTLGLSLLLGLSRVDREVFGTMNSPVSQVRKQGKSPIFDKIGGGSQVRTTSSSRMPLNDAELRVLRSFRSGVDRKAKKAYLRELRLKYV